VSVIDSKYLPFPADEVEGHLAKSSSVAGGTNDGESLKRQGVLYYEISARKYAAFLLKHPHRVGLPVSSMREDCQIEKDERFWTVAALLKVHKGGHWAELLAKCFPAIPPSLGETSWQDLIGPEPELLFEAPLPSPQGYHDYLKRHLKDRHLIPYILEAGSGNRTRFEGFTHADAILLSRTGFSVVFEAKVESDISTQITFDLTRNQIVRYLDVLLENPRNQAEPLSWRDRTKTLFVLLTPELFRKNRASRLYGWLMDDYRSGDGESKIKRDLPHRKDEDLSSLPSRLGWLTWEDCNRVVPDSCPWLPSRV
jgi:hypothetical protein